MLTQGQVNFFVTRLQIYSIAIAVSNLVDFLSGMTWRAIRDLDDPELK